MDADTGRDGGGRFMKGNKLACGRPRGTPNQTSVDMQRIRAEVAASWDRVDGQSKLVQLAEDDFVEYLRIVVKLLPRETRVATATAPFVERLPEPHGGQARRFVDALEARERWANHSRDGFGYAPGTCAAGTPRS